eukprot:COSAG02_NODE_42_length_46522_cov_109.704478_33_plen_86_part_00
MPGVTLRRPGIPVGPGAWDWAHASELGYAPPPGAAGRARGTRQAKHFSSQYVAETAGLLATKSAMAHGIHLKNVAHVMRTRVKNR